MYLSIAMNTRCKFQYKSGLYFLNFPSNVSQETIFTDGFESMSTWDKTNNSFGHSLTALDTAKKKSGSYSGRIDDNYPRQWSKYVYSDTWTPINNSKDTYYTVSGWVYVEDVTTNGSLPNLAKLWIVTRKQGERGYPTGHISTSSTKEGTWEYLSKTVLIPADVKEINVRIENARLGKVWFDDVKIVKGNTSQTVIVEESNYYPFGLEHKGYNNVTSSNGNSTAQKFGFGGKELSEELGIDNYDFGARNYNPDLGRWFSIDPLAELMRSQSPYNFGFNNPIYFSDYAGTIPWPVPEMFKNWFRRIDSKYGMRTRRGKTKLHAGIDINFTGGGNTDYGAPVVATHSGKVAFVQTSNTGSGGRYIEITSPDGSFKTRYLHLSSVVITAGQEISEGQTIGLLGGSGYGLDKSTDGGKTGYLAHLHYEIYRNGSSVDPLDNKGNPIDPQKWVQRPLEEKYTFNSTLLFIFDGSSTESDSDSSSSNTSTTSGGSRPAVTPLPSLTPAGITPVSPGTIPGGSIIPSPPTPKPSPGVIVIPPKPNCLDC